MASEATVGPPRRSLNHSSDPPGAAAGPWQPGTVGDTVVAFERRFATAQATEVVDLPWGYAVLQREFPQSYDHNRVVITAMVPADEVLTATDEVLGGAGLHHRYVSADDPGGRRPA